MRSPGTGNRRRSQKINPARTGSAQRIANASPFQGAVHRRPNGNDFTVARQQIEAQGRRQTLDFALFLDKYRTRKGGSPKRDKSGRREIFGAALGERTGRQRSDLPAPAGRSGGRIPGLIVSSIIVSSIEDACAPCANRPSCAPPRGRHGSQNPPRAACRAASRRSP